jgi:dihydrofolate reductase
MAHHRKIATSMQVSLDGLAERPSGATDWIGTNPDTFDWELLDRIDACVLGSAMYPDYQHYWRTINADPAEPLAATGSPPTADEVRYSELANRTQHYVLTSNPGDLDWPVSRTIPDFDAVRGLRDEAGGDIYVVGGPTTVAGLLDADLIDELRLTVHPVVLGAGTPLFGRVGREHRLQLTSATPLESVGREHRLQLTSATPLESGVVRLVYGRDG